MKKNTWLWLLGGAAAFWLLSRKKNALSGLTDAAAVPSQYANTMIQTFAQLLQASEMAAQARSAKVKGSQVKQVKNYIKTATKTLKQQMLSLGQQYPQATINSLLQASLDAKTYQDVLARSQKANLSKLLNTAFGSVYKKYVKKAKDTVKAQQQQAQQQAQAAAQSQYGIQYAQQQAAQGQQLMQQISVGQQQQQAQQQAQSAYDQAQAVAAAKAGQQAAMQAAGIWIRPAPGQQVSTGDDATMVAVAESGGDGGGGGE